MALDTPGRIGKVCIVGAGAVGGFIGTRLAQAGRASVSALARGPTLAALRQHGWRLSSDDQQIQVPAQASDDPRQLGVQDLVVVALKGHALPAAAPDIAALIGPGTVVLPAMNGIPWWFCHADHRFPDGLRAVDPDGAIAASIALRAVLGCVVHGSTSTRGPGLFVHHKGQGLILGEPTGGTSPRAEAVGALLAHAGFDVRISAGIRQDIWYKLWGNMSMNPVSALTGATCDVLLADPLVRRFCSSVMEEAAQIGAGIGCTVTEDPEARHAVTEKLGAFRTSMLQDADAGRRLEIDTIVAAVREIGQRLGIATPHIDALLGLVRVFARTRQLD